MIQKRWGSFRVSSWNIFSLNFLDTDLWHTITDAWVTANAVFHLYYNNSCKCWQWDGKDWFLSGKLVILSTNINCSHLMICHHVRVTALGYKWICFWGVWGMKCSQCPLIFPVYTRGVKYSMNMLNQSQEVTADTSQDILVGQFSFSLYFL